MPHCSIKTNCLQREREGKFLRKSPEWDAIRGEELSDVFLNDDVTVNQIGALQLTFDGYLTLHQIGEDHHTVLALDAHDVLHDDGCCIHLIAVNSRQAHNRISLSFQTVEDNAQAHIALLKIGHGCHDLLVSSVGASLLQLDGQVSQFLGMGSIVAHHVLHQSHQFLHGGMLAGGTAAAAATGTAMGVFVVMMIMVMIVMMVVTVVVKMLVGVGMFMVMGMSMNMLVRMGMTVMSMLMGMGMIVIVMMHSGFSFNFSFIIPVDIGVVKTFIFAKISPRWACGTGGNGV